MATWNPSMLLSPPRDSQPGPGRRHVHRQTGGRLQPAAEVEECDQYGRVVNPAVEPARLPERVHVSVLDQAGRLGQLLRVSEQRSRRWFELKKRPGGRELRVEMLVAGETAQGRRVQSQSRSAADGSVDDGGDHLALKRRETGGTSHVEVREEAGYLPQEPQVRKQNCRDPGQEADPPEDDRRQPASQPGAGLGGEDPISRTRLNANMAHCSYVALHLSISRSGMNLKFR